jgi:hypothetical protein
MMAIPIVPPTWRNIQDRSASTRLVDRHAPSCNSGAGVMVDAIPIRR